MNNPAQPDASRILKVIHETDAEYTFRLQTDMKPEHGQFVELSIPTIGEAPISVSGTGDGWIELTVRRVGKVTNVLFEKTPGDNLFIRGPYGHGWPMDEIRGKHLVVAAGGTGVSPVRSLLNAAAEDGGLFRSVNVVCGFKNSGSVLFKDDLDVWKKNFNAVFCLDDEETGCFRKGLVTKFLKDIPFDSFGGDYAVLIVGPHVMMKYAGLEFIRLGCDPGKMWMSFERKMSCGLGKCGHCRIDEVYVCLDGPVFPYTLASKLID